jgi:UDP-2-acetamido-3-amino-2,3-dideoxy-glucuronate N-acetyltransferase
MSSNKTPRVMVAGAGYWGKNLVRNFHGLGALATVCDTNAEQREALVTQYPGSKGSNDYAESLVDPALDAVAIATPASQHGEMVRAALVAGKDVYVEKPLCLSETEGRDLTKLARDRGRVLMVGHLLWYHPAVVELKRLISAGNLGRVQYIYSNRLNMGKLRQEENVLWSFAPHDVSVIVGLLGEIPESVQASGGNYLHQRIADTTVSLLNFASGVRAHIFVSWLHPFKEQKLVVVGERAMAVFDDTMPWPEKLTLYPHSVTWDGPVPVARKADAQPVTLEEGEPLRAECEHFLDCVRSREQSRTDGAEGLRVLTVLNACQRALESGRQEEVSPSSADFYVHETAVVDPGAEIGAGTRIWHYSHVLPRTHIGADCTVGQNVMVGPDVTVGDRCKIQNNVSLYKGVTLEDGVFCAPSCVFTNVMNPRAEIERKDEFRTTLVKRGATIGANATIVCGVTIGEYAFIGAGAVVTRDVPAHALVVGSPARRIGWMSQQGERLDENLTCPVTGTRYREAGSGLEAIA